MRYIRWHNSHYLYKGDDSENFHFFPRAFKISADLCNHLPELYNKLDLKVTNMIAENWSRRVNPEEICRKPFSNTSEIGWIIFL